MIKLTINQIALGTIKRRGRQVRAILMGAGLAIFFVSTLFLAVQSVYATYKDMHIAQMGSEDAIIRDSGKISEEVLFESGLISEIGNVYVLAKTTNGSGIIGCYDLNGAKMAGRSLSIGRMPENAGEIALEPGFLYDMRRDLKVGDEIELELQYARGAGGRFLPDSVKKTYTIVGILETQSIYLKGNVSSDDTFLAYPNSVVSSDEFIESGEEVIVHRLIRFSEGVSLSRFKEYAENELGISNTLSTSFNLFGSQSGNNQGDARNIVILTIAVGIVLVISACLGIINAFSASLTERRRQIGMMRAVGATSSQIRSIFGREALLLAILIAPLSIALSFLFVWGMTEWIGFISFSFSLWLLLTIFVISLLCVILSACFPLSNISRVTPMQAIRDVTLQREKKKIRLHSRSTFDVSRLISSRYLSLYKTKQLGIAFVVALSMLLITASLPIILNIWNQPTQYDYQIIGEDELAENPFIGTNVDPHRSIIESDIMEIATLPLVSTVDRVSTAQIGLLLDEITPYSANMRYSAYYRDASNNEYATYYQNLKKQFNVDKEVLAGSIYAFDENIVASIGPDMLGGAIDIDELNSGREVLLAVPREYYRYSDDEGSTYTVYAPPKVGYDVSTLTNDTFQDGDELHIMQLYTEGSIDENAPFSNVQRIDATVKIGAIINRDASDAYGLSSLGLFIGDKSVITTIKGLAALGIRTDGYRSIGIRLSSAPDDATDAYLTDVLKVISARGDNLQFKNNYQSDRNAALWQTLQKLSLSAILLLLLSMCVSLVNHAVTNRVRSDRRSIGTLRAVGAPMSVIIRSYEIQAFTMISWGIIMGVMCSGVICIWYHFVFYLPSGFPFPTILLVVAVFLITVWILCWINIRSRIRKTTHDSIVANIREL